MADENVVYVGKKSLMSYVLAVITQFNNGQEKVVIKARGKAISKAVDVAEIVKERFLKDAKVEDIKIGTVNLENQEQGGTVRVSEIEITLAR
ncbi:MAG TPA: DNA-binding protein Alba [Candidatus Altiarchaeales archaeon]|nr:MAG: DNA-binding protein Alba [Candidatus Altiarchaeales archaeon]HDN83146.1 DNA-binding protein Alba [Candidatus Altiarchaeales archaeon]